MRICSFLISKYSSCHYCYSSPAVLVHHPPPSLPTCSYHGATMAAIMVDHVLLSLSTCSCHGTPYAAIMAPAYHSLYTFTKVNLEKFAPTSYVRGCTLTEFRREWIFFLTPFSKLLRNYKSYPMIKCFDSSCMSCFKKIIFNTYSFHCRSI